MLERRKKVVRSLTLIPILAGERRLAGDRKLAGHRRLAGDRRLGMEAGDEGLLLNHRRSNPTSPIWDYINFNAVFVVSACILCYEKLKIKTICGIKVVKISTV